MNNNIRIELTISFIHVVILGEVMTIDMVIPSSHSSNTTEAMCLHYLIVVVNITESRCVTLFLSSHGEQYT